MALRKKVLFLNSLVVVAILALAFWLYGVVGDNEGARDMVSRFGYTGVFLLSLVGGFNVFVPVPVVSFLPVFIGAGLDLLQLVLVITVGMTTADIAAFYVGKRGRSIVDEATEKKIMDKLQLLQSKHSWLPILAVFMFACIAPLPNEVMVLPLGFLGYQIRYIAVAVFVGNFIFNTAYALGLVKLFNIL